MEVILIFWALLAVALIAQVWNVVYFIRHGETSGAKEDYADETIEYTEIVMDAIKSKKIKKHIITNSANKYDSKQTLQKYRNFLKSELMSDIMAVNEEKYNG